MIVKNIVVLTFLGLALVFVSCKKTCVDKNNLLIGECPDTTNVVCGCNDKTYKNPCEALKEGISKENQKAGSCK